MRRCAGMLVVVSATALMAGSAAAQKLLRDPFNHPKPTVLARPDTPVVVSEEWKPELRAVMFDKGRSLIDVGGKILALGESVGGYRLIKVEERSAVLSKNGVQITLKLDKEKLP